MDVRQVADLEQRSFSDAAAVAESPAEPGDPVMYLGVLGLTPPAPVLADEE